MAGNRIGAGGPFLVASLISLGGTSGPLGAFVSNANAPDPVDLSISGWVVGTSQALQGKVPKTVFTRQDDPTQRDPDVWPSIRAGKTPTVPAFTPGWAPQADSTQIGALLWRSQPAVSSAAAGRVSGTPQTDPSNLAPIVWPSVVRGATPPVLPFLQAAPELVDLSISGWTINGALANRSLVPPLIFTQPYDLSQLAAVVWKSQPAQISATPNPVAGFFSASPQIEDRSTRAIWKSLQPPPAIVPGPLATFFVTAPEWIDLSISGWTVGGSQFSATTSGPLASFFSIPQQVEDRPTRSIWHSVIGYANPLAPEYRFGTHAQATYDAEARKSILWKSQPAAPAIGPVPAQTRGTPQADPSLNPTQVWTPSTFQPPITGVTVRPIVFVPAQFNISPNGTMLWTPSTFSQGAAPPNRHKLYYDVSSGRLFWQVSSTSNPILIEPL